MLEQLQSFVEQSLPLWQIPKNAKIRIINLSENTTYKIEAPQWQSILRVHRYNYHSENAIKSELAWAKALQKENVIETPQYISGIDGKIVQWAEFQPLKQKRHMVMFKFINGKQPNESSELNQTFEQLGTIAAKTHLHSQKWQKPANFERFKWNLDTILGQKPIWGKWQKAPNVTAEIKKILQAVEKVIRKRLNAFGYSRQRYGLIHADMRLANLLIENNKTRLIDFDDCGFGWYLYDFATAVSFIENHPDIDELKQNWLEGYCKVKKMQKEEFNEIDSLVQLRRLALLAWIGSHAEAPEPQQFAPYFAEESALLAQKYLKKFS